MILRVFTLGVVMWLCSPSDSSAEIYKYVDKDGNVAYTDNLSALPPDRRAFYTKKKKERAKTRKQLEDKLGKEELERRETERKLRALEKKKLNAREFKRRKAALDARLRDFDRRRSARIGKIQDWQRKLDNARSKLKDKLKQHQALRKTADQAAFQYASTAMLAHAQRREKALKQMKKLEPEIDALAQKIRLEIPAKARAAGVRVK
ncbi:MAG: DUF4124 domain-containing protein [Myxococcota bacterium]|nr:DUF4124 domain-containing protein [Myxococcota bacterium]